MHTQSTPATARATVPHRPSADLLLRVMVRVSLVAGPLGFLLLETAGSRNP